MSLFVGHFVVMQQDAWRAPLESDGVVRKVEQYRLVSLLFEAPEAASAYDKASAMVRGLDDAHCDGQSDRTNYIGVGILDLEEVELAGRSLVEAVREPYGVDVGNIQWPSEAPKVRLREELSVFLPHGA